jgi:SAM-dependent methyltransferase
MAESTTGIRAVLSRPASYEIWSRLVGGEHGRSTLVREHVRPWPGARVLDLGCGPGELLRYPGDVHYVGVDIDERYITRARHRHGDRAEFRVGDATALDADLRGFDIVLAFGMVHHLDDDAAFQAYASMASALRPGGRAVTVDPARAPGQKFFARLLLSWDRGNYPRGAAEYSRLAALVLEDVQTTLRSDLLRFPYTHCILECTRGGAKSLHS